MDDTTQHTELNDITGNELKGDLGYISQVTQLTLAQTLEKSNEVLQNPESTKEQLQEALKALATASAAATAITKSINSFDEGRDIEQQAIAEAMNPTSEVQQTQEPMTPEQRLESFCAAAAVHFGDSNKNLKKASSLLGQSPHLADALSQAHPDATPQQAQQSFWKKVANAALAIEVMIERVNSFPSRVASSIKSSFTSRKDAVTDTVHQFEDRAQREMTALKTGVHAVIDSGMESIRNKMDYVGAAKDATVGHYKERSQQFETFLENKVTGPLFSFVSERAVPAIKSWTIKVDDFLHSDMFVNDKRSLREKFERSIEDRRMARQPVVQEPSQTQTLG